VVENEGDDGYPPLRVFVFTNSGGDPKYVARRLIAMMNGGDEGHFRFGALCDAANEGEDLGEEGEDGFDAFFALDFNTDNRDYARSVVTTYFGSDVAFAKKRGTYGLKHI
jgi:hypothetical protein